MRASTLRNSASSAVKFLRFSRHEAVGFTQDDENLGGRGGRPASSPVFKAGQIGALRRRGIDFLGIDRQVADALAYLGWGDAAGLHELMHGGDADRCRVDLEKAP